MTCKIKNSLYNYDSLVCSNILNDHLGHQVRELLECDHAITVIIGLLHYQAYIGVIIHAKEGFELLAGELAVP